MGYRNPEDVYYGPYQYAHRTKQDTYSHWQAQPAVIQNFKIFMNGGKLNDGRRWCDWVSAEDVLIQGFRDSDSDDSALLVDVGGGWGHDLAALTKRHPDAPGRLILQDLPEVIHQVACLDPRIERMSYDFFDAQPVKGKLLVRSRAYSRSS